jgi:DNA-binding response OmpR family regulator
MKRIVIAEDDLFMREELGDILLKEQYEIAVVEDFRHTVREIEKCSPDLVLLDVNLPGSSGFEICRELKKHTAVPVLILTSRDQLSDELHALDFGADDYLTKPCHKERLVARLSNLLRRYEGRTHLLDGNGFLLDRQTYTLYVDKTSKVLTENEGKILELLMTRQGELVSKEELFFALWGTTEYIDENALQVNMTRLRKNLKEQSLDGRIDTVRGKGYRLL